MINTFLMVSTSSISMQRLGKIVKRVPAVGAKMWCLSLFVFCLSRSKAGALFVRGGHSFSNYCVTFCWSILMQFLPFSVSQGPFRWTR